MPYCGMCAAEHATTERFCGRCGAPTQPTTATPTDSAVPSHQQQRTVLPAASAQATFDARVVGGAVHALVGEFGQLPFRTLVPLRAWWEQRVWQQSWAALFLIAAITPFLLLHLGGDPGNFHKVAWGFSLYFAFIWFIALSVLIRPEQLPWQLLGKVALFTAVAGVAIAISLEKHLAAGDPNVVRLILGVGLPEELAKALPVYLFVFRSPQPRTLRSFLFVGAVSGLAFGAAEAVSYSTAFAQVLPFISDANSAVITEIWRLVTDSLFHACLAGITAFFLGLAYSYRSFSIGLIGFGLVFTATLHGLYDNFANGWLGAALAIAIVLVFVGYVATCDEIGAQFHEHASTAPAKAPLSATWADRTWIAASPAPVVPHGDTADTAAGDRDSAAAGSAPLAHPAAGAGP